VRGVCILLLWAVWPATALAALPDYPSVREAWRPSDVRVLSAEGVELQRVRVDFSSRRGDWVALDQVSPALQHAVIASEDHRFAAHHGVDWLASASAAWSLLGAHSRRGASTISMQLVALLDPDLQRGPGGRSVLQKWSQMQHARELETRWTKARILEAYLNQAAWRGELVGVDALARVLFRKRAAGLTLRESALAAVLLRGPNAPAEVLVERACHLLRELGQPADCIGLPAFVRSVLARAQGPRQGAPALAPHWARYVLAHGPDATRASVRTTLRADLQQHALAAVRRHLGDLRGTGVTDAAVVVLDNRTGAVLAYVGSSGARLSAASQVDHALALRQAGSTLKPFLYGLALDQQRLTAASLLDDSPLDLQAGSGLYIPDNYDHHFAGWVSVRQALAASLNVPAVRTLMMIGPEPFSRQLRALGLPLREAGDYYGYSLALGSADVSLLSLTNAYRTLARGGVFAPIVLQRAAHAQPGGGVAIYSAEAAWLVGHILADREARVRTFGLDSPLATRFWSAAKTGTSRDMRDNWCIGWSADYTVGVWVGNSAGASMRRVSGVTGAGPIWHDILAWLHRSRPSVPPARPGGLVVQAIGTGSASEPPREEYFLGDTAQAVFAHAPSADQAARMAEPVAGSVLALDPDIPWSRQRQRLRAVDVQGRPVDDVSWRVDGSAVPDSPEGVATWWAPVPGAHEFELYDSRGRRLEHARVRVRAASFDVHGDRVVLPVQP